MTTTDDTRALDEWSQRLTQALQILDLKIDHSMLLELADRASRTITPSAGAISTFVVGYAAGLATTSGERASTEAVQTAANTALLALDDGTSEAAPASDGWSDTAQ
jgi:hypothetical protein